ncbi:MAG: universal stress protein [Actinomycetia bacterium]|nr:universal stress protein [Actinomycetes bacterium]
MKIVVGYVMTDESRAALEWAIEDSRRHGSHLVVVHSIRGGGSIEAEEQEVLAYRKELDAIDRRLTNEGIPHTVRRLIRGLSPAEDLVAVVSEEEADMIVIGIRRRSRTGKLLLGSDALEILLLADCPVLGVKAKSQQTG